MFHKEILIYVIIKSVNKLKILHTEWSDGMGGQEKRVLYECKGLLERGHSVTLVCRENSRIKEKAIELGIEVITLPLRKPYDIKSIIKLAKILKQRKIDIINTHSGIDSWIGAIAGKIAGVKAIVRTRHLELPLRRNIFNFIHYFFNLFISCGNNIRKFLIEKCGFPPEKVINIPTGVESKFFKIERDKELKKYFGLDQNQPIIINVGILRAMKNHELTIEAFYKVLKDFPMARLFIVGDGPRKNFLEKYVKKLKLENFVIFTGFQEDITPFLAMADVFVLSSRYAEGLPQAVLQAMAAGVPVVATSVGGVPEVLKHEITGLLSKSNEADELAENIIKIIKNPALGEKMAENAKKEIKEKYSLAAMLDKIESVYMELVSK